MKLFELAVIARANVDEVQPAKSLFSALHLKEMEFRYNHRDEDIYPIIVKYLSDLVPKRE